MITMKTVTTVTTNEKGDNGDRSDNSDNDDNNDNGDNSDNSRELKRETFSGGRRPDSERKPGTEAAVASRQKSNIKTAVNSEGRRF